MAVVVAALLGLAGCSTAPSLSVATVENAAGERAFVLDGIDGDQLIDLPAVAGEISVSDGCFALTTSDSVYVLVLPEGARFNDDGLLDTTQGSYEVGESVSLRGETAGASELAYGDQLPADCGSDRFLALSQINN